jgi:hypothetical protein
MKILNLFIVILLLLGSCKKDVAFSGKKAININQSAAAKLLAKPNLSQYTRYVIARGSHYCTASQFAVTNYSELTFSVLFDSSAVYKTDSIHNQGDINKLYGFSDNNALHQDYSARVGWRWYKNRLELLAYDYNSHAVNSAFITAVPLGTIITCSIKVQTGSYLFTINGVSKTMKRTSATTTAKGYQLYPYFGGTETAKQEVSIWIKNG